MVMALYAIAELIEARSVDRARNAIKSLLALTPETAEVKQANGAPRITRCFQQTSPHNDDPGRIRLNIRS
jgi:cation transport ATPase